MCCKRVIASLLVLFCTIPAWSQAKLSVHWEELTGADFRDGIRQSQGTCLLPFGILEKHGPHLPLGTDLLNVRYATLHAAQQDYAVVFPSITLDKFSKLNTSPAPSPIARSCNLRCYRKLPTKWRATVAKRSS